MLIKLLGSIHSIKGYRKMPFIVLIAKPLFDFVTNCMYMEFVSFDEEGDEEGQPLDMIPVCMRKKDTGGTIAFQISFRKQLHSQFPDSGAGIDYDKIIVFGSNLQARSVAPVGMAQRKGQGVDEAIHRRFVDDVGGCCIKGRVSATRSASYTFRCSEEALQGTTSGETSIF